MQTDRTIPNKTPDIIIRDNKEGTCILIDVAVPEDRNAIKKEAEKIFIYETPPMRNMKAKVIPVLIEAIGTISKSLRQYLSYTTGRN